MATGKNLAMKVGAIAWYDQNYSITDFPAYLDGGYFFQIPFKGVTKGTKISVSTTGPASIHLFVENVEMMSGSGNYKVLSLPAQGTGVSQDNSGGSDDSYGHSLREKYCTKNGGFVHTKSCNGSNCKYVALENVFDCKHYEEHSFAIQDTTKSSTAMLIAVTPICPGNSYTCINHLT